MSFWTRFNTQHWVFITLPYITQIGGTWLPFSCARIERKKEGKSVAQRFISIISYSNRNLQALVLFLVTCKRWRPAVPGFCTHRLLYCSSISSRNWYLAHALALQVGSNIIGFAIAAGMFVCDGTHSTYNYFILFLFSIFMFCQLNIKQKVTCYW